MATKITPAVKPNSVAICEIAEIAYARAEALIRNGYSFDLSMPPEHFGWSGQVSIHMVLPTPAAIQ